MLIRREIIKNVSSTKYFILGISKMFGRPFVVAAAAEFFNLLSMLSQVFFIIIIFKIKWEGKREREKV